MLQKRGHWHEVEIMMRWSCEVVGTECSLCPVNVLDQDKTLSVILDSLPLHTCLFNLRPSPSWPASPCPRQLLHWPVNRPPSRTWTVVMTYQQDYLSPCLYLSALSVSQIMSLPCSNPSMPSPYTEGLCGLSYPQNLTDGASSPTSVPAALMPHALYPPRCSQASQMRSHLGSLYLWFLIAETLPYTSVCSIDSFASSSSNSNQKPSQLPTENGNIISVP